MSRKFQSLIRGHNFKRFTDFLSRGAEKIYNAAAPLIGNFADAAMKSVEGNVNNRDNWGAFGTLLTNKAIELLTTPSEKVNAALPPTQGSVVRYGPALPPTDETIVIDTSVPPAPVARPITTKKVMTAPDRPPVIETSKSKKSKAKAKAKVKSKPKSRTRSKVKGKDKTVSEMTSPKIKKTKKYRYKGEI